MWSLGSADVSFPTHPLPVSDRKAANFNVAVAESYGQPSLSRFCYCTVPRVDELGTCYVYIDVRFVSVRSGEGGPGSPSLFGSCLIRQLLDSGGGSGSLLAVSPFY